MPPLSTPNYPHKRWSEKKIIPRVGQHGAATVARPRSGSTCAGEHGRAWPSRPRSAESFCACVRHLVLGFWAAGVRARARPGKPTNSRCLGVFSFQEVRLKGVAGYSDTNKKNKLHNPSVLRKMNLLSLINPSLTYVYCSILLSNHKLIRLKRFVSQNSLNLCI
jgi:hypothetical protein